MLKEKRSALPMPEPTPVLSQHNVINLMDALKRSLAAEEASAPKAATAKATKPKKPKKAAAGQREMLLPITGKGTGKEAAKEKAKERARPAARQRKAG
jgi:DNA end-binding protein Ku